MDWKDKDGPLSPMEIELLRNENQRLTLELNATRDKLAQAKRLLDRAQPLIEQLRWIEPAERVLAKKLTIIEGLLWDWYYTKNGWTKFWATGQLLVRIRETVYAKES